MSRLGFEHSTFRLQGERFNPLRHRRGLGLSLEAYAQLLWPLSSDTQPLASGSEAATPYQNEWRLSLLGFEHVTFQRMTIVLTEFLKV